MIQQFTLVINVQILVRHFESDTTERLTIINYIYTHTHTDTYKDALVLVMSNSCNPKDYSLSGSSVYGISQQEYRSWLPFPSPGNIANPENKPASPALAGTFFTTEPPGKSPQRHMYTHFSTQACIICNYCKGYNL